MGYGSSLANVMAAMPPPPPAFAWTKGMAPGFQAAMLPLEEVTSMAGLGGKQSSGPNPPAAPAAAAPPPASEMAAAGAAGGGTPARRGAARYGGAPSQTPDMLGAAAPAGTKQLTGQ